MTVMTVDRLITDELTGAQRRVLRGRAHSLKPVVIVGRQGLTETVAREIDSALDYHELIKVRVEGERDERSSMANRIEQELGCSAVGAVGKVLVLYRQQEDEAKRRVEI